MSFLSAVSRRLALAILLVALAASSPAAAQDEAPSPEEAARLAREAEAAREDAARLAREAEAREAQIERLQRALVEAARAQGDSERAALAAESRLAALAAEETLLSGQVEADRTALADVFAALVRIERARPPAALVSGRDALDAARAAGLLAEIAPALDARAAETLERLATLRLVRAGIVGERANLAEAESSLAGQRAELASLVAALIAERDRLRADSAGRTEAAAALAARSESVLELIAAINARSADFTPDERPARAAAIPTPRLKPRGAEIGAAPPPFTPPTGRFADARGALALPAAGDVVSQFGERTASDTREGMVIRTRRGALVTSPFEARIEYAGSFRGYGQLLILSVGDDYHLVLAGLSTIYGVAGQTVLAGEPVGEMSELSDSARDLYLEIRKDGRPIDPSPWWRR